MFETQPHPALQCHLAHFRYPFGKCLFSTHRTIHTSKIMYEPSLCHSTRQNAIVNMNLNAVDHIGEKKAVHISSRVFFVVVVFLTFHSPLCLVDFCTTFYTTFYVFRLFSSVDSFTFLFSFCYELFPLLVSFFHKWWSAYIFNQMCFSIIDCTHRGTSALLKEQFYLFVRLCTHFITFIFMKYYETERERKKLTSFQYKSNAII